MQLSLFSISYAGLWGQEQLGLPTMIRKAGQLGYDSVMLAGKRPHLSPLDAHAELLNEVVLALAEAKVSCGAIAAYVDFGAQVAAEVPLLEMQLAYVESLARVAAHLHCPLVRVFTAYESPGAGPARAWKQTVAALQEACDRAAAHDVKLAIQNHHDLAVDTDALLELLSDVDRPNCGLGYDAWSPALRGEDLFQSALKAASYTWMTTSADYIRLPRYRYRPEVVNYEPVQPDLVRAVPFGTGFIDYEAFFNGLREGGYDGLATYEMCSPIRGGGAIENLDRYAQTYVDWMRRHQFA